MKRLLFSILLLCSLPAMAWKWWPLPMDDARPSGDTLTCTFGLSAIASSGKYAPFWLQTNQEGQVSASPFSGRLTASVSKAAGSPSRWFDYDFAATLSASAFSPLPLGPLKTGVRQFPEYSWKQASVQVNRLYAHARLFIVDVTAGVVPLVQEMPDQALSSGGLLFSGNTAPMPRISAGIDRYTAVPGLFGYLEIKGGITHAWQSDNVYVDGTLIHYKYVGARVGGRLPIQISYEFHHAVQWGGISPEYGNMNGGLSTYWHIFKAGAGGNMINDADGAEGNHIGVQQLRLDVNRNDWHASFYWQTIFEDKSASFIGRGTNLADGLWGISLRQDRWPFIHGITVEYIGTTDQSGPFHDQDGLVFGGRDNYYRNGIYLNGWNYFFRSIGTPFVESPLYKEDHTLFTAHNRIKTWHAGINGDILGYQYRILASYTRSFGEYQGYYTDQDYYSVFCRNTALMLEVNKQVRKVHGLELGLRLGADIGNQFGNNFGAEISIRKHNISKTW